jgi:hypothetical protein
VNHGRDEAGEQSLRVQVLGLVTDMKAALGFEPRVHFDGPVDPAIDEVLAGDLLAVLRELLSKVAHHARRPQLRRRVPARRVGDHPARQGAAAGERPDTLVVEEPLEIRVGGRPMSVYDANARGSARQWEQALASPALSAVWKLCPQPQVLTALGLLIVKPPPMTAST